MQVNDDFELLHLMMADSRSAAPIYQATNYWKFMERKLMPELKIHGLRDFRRRPRTPLQSFGGVDCLPLPPHIDLFDYRLLNNRYTVRISGYERFLERLELAISRKFPLRTGVSVRTANLEKIAIDRAELFASKFGALPVSNISASTIGNPEWTFEAYGKTYTRSFINKYLDYAYACQFINFNEIKCFVELGGGAARQIEMIHKMHPNITILLFEIPPQLYVGEQYLQAVFPNRIVGYRKTREYQTMPSLKKGMIYVFGAQQFPLIENCPVDLFWNAASFQEMEPDVVANYLSYVNRFAKAVFLQQVMSGKHEAAAGKAGVLKKTTESNYRAGLPNFECTDLSPTINADASEVDTGPGGYYNSFWRLRGLHRRL